MMLHKPKKRICPSLICRICVNTRRQPLGDMKGNNPSSTNTSANASANASQKISLSTAYFLAAAAGAPWPRNTLKNSEDEGSTTITSVFLPRLAL